MTKITDHLVMAARSVGQAPLPMAAQAMALHCLQDWFAVLLAGQDSDVVKAVLNNAKSSGGKPQATLLGNGDRLDCISAAMINGTASHILDLDDAHLGSRVHPSAPLWPAILAICEWRGLSGEQALRAFVVGVQFQTGLADLIGESHYQRGWHSTGTLGSFGATLACANLIGFDHESTCHAIGLTATRAGGLRSVFGSMAKPLQVGQAAANGVWAVELVERGVRSVRNVLDGDIGFLALYGDNIEQPAWDLSATSLSVESITFKYHAACYGTQAPIEAALKIITNFDVQLADITRVDVEVEEQYLSVCNVAQPTTVEQAKFSIRHMVAMALSGLSTTDSDSFSAAVRDAPEINALRAKIKVAGSQTRQRATAKVTVLTVSGDELAAEVDSSQPEQDIKQRANKIDQKTRALLSGYRCPIDTETLIAACRDFATAENVSTWIGRLYAEERQHQKVPTIKDL